MRMTRRGPGRGCDTKKRTVFESTLERATTAPREPLAKKKETKRFVVVNEPLRTLRSQLTPMQGTNPRRKFIVDTDAGVDDAGIRVSL